MKNGYLRLPQAPQWCIQYPTCSACELDLDVDYDAGWLCVSCGTTWPLGAEDGDLGQVNEAADGPQVSMDDAWRVAKRDR